MTPPSLPPRRFGRRSMLFGFLALLFVPIAAKAALFSLEERPRNFREASWASTGSLPDARAHPDARILVMSGRTGGWKGVLAVHSWIVFKRENADHWTRYDVVGWGRPLRQNGWAPDARWYGTAPTVVADLSGAQARALIPKVEAAVKDYRYAEFGDYRLWPGPNSNSFVAAVLRAVPEMKAVLPPNAIGRDFRPDLHVGWTDSGTGVEVNLWGFFGARFGWIEGVEINVLGLVVGLDLRNPALKLPAFGLLSLDLWPQQAGAGTPRT
ncbi:MAG: DUF3750 domain-containing protein [Pseudorhodoplanes sp.]|nr:DUF3750 domain-containing protein [Pseudorhodoplanes sp.]MCQ3942295.1 DUF3750 domain-containing protein [Alphaproteobacteria bacterium]